MPLYGYCFGSIVIRTILYAAISVCLEPSFVERRTCHCINEATKVLIIWKWRPVGKGRGDVRTVVRTLGSLGDEAARNNAVESGFLAVGEGIGNMGRRGGQVS